jgi:hypothetical protein
MSLNLVLFLNKKSNLKDQRSYLTIYLYFVVPLGYLISQGVSILTKGWSQYHFNATSFASLIIMDLLLVSPLIYNYYKQSRKYKKILRKFDPRFPCNVKAIFDYRNFAKNQIYRLEDNSVLIDAGMSKLRYVRVIDNNGIGYNLEDIVNKFELDDIKEERKKKLLKLKWKKRINIG